MFVKIDSAAVDEGLVAFSKAITLMRRNRLILEPVSRFVIVASLALVGYFSYSDAFIHFLHSALASTFFMAVGILAVAGSAVIEIFITIVIASGVRSLEPPDLSELRRRAKIKFIESLNDEPLATIAMTLLMLIGPSIGFLIYFFAILALQSQENTTQLLISMFSVSFCAAVISSVASLHGVIWARYILVHGIRATQAFGQAQQCIAKHTNACSSLCFGITVLAFFYALLAHLVVANHIECPSIITDLIGGVLAVSMFIIMWIVQCVPYLIATERRRVS